MSEVSASDDMNRLLVSNSNNKACRAPGLTLACDCFCDIPNHASRISFSHFLFFQSGAMLRCRSVSRRAVAVLLEEDARVSCVLSEPATTITTQKQYQSELLTQCTLGVLCCVGVEDPLASSFCGLPTWHMNGFSDSSTLSSSL